MGARKMWQTDEDEGREDETGGRKMTMETEKSKMEAAIKQKLETERLETEDGWII